MLKLFFIFFLIGLFTFGGGYAMIPLIESETIGRGLLDTETFYNMVAISESTPGPIAVNMATFIGFRTYGVFGAILSTLGVILPSFLIILLIASILKHFMEKPLVKAIFYGLKAVVIGLIAATAVSFIYDLFVIGVDPINIDFIAIIIFAIVLLSSLIYKKIKKKSLSPYIIIISSGLLGLILYSIYNLL